MLCYYVSPKSFFNFGESITRFLINIFFFTATKLSVVIFYKYFSNNFIC